MGHREGRQSGGRSGGGQHAAYGSGEWYADPMQRNKMMQQMPMRGADEAEGGVGAFAGVYGSGVYFTGDGAVRRNFTTTTAAGSGSRASGRE